MTGTELAKTCADSVNSMCFDKKGFCNEMSHEHRALQDNFTNLCFEWLLKCKKMYETGEYDGRNELSCKAAKMCMEALGY